MRLAGWWAPWSPASSTYPGSSPAAAVASPDTGDTRARGTVEVADRAIERIARAAVLAVDGVAPAASTAGGLGTALGRTYPRLDCEIAGDHVRASVEIAIRWPASARQVGEKVQAAVTTQLHHLAGLHVDSVRVVVAQVVRHVADEPRRVR
ncbi:Asp23/Gls24 family envelope stress response protein [Georgenia yuyongxinii]|uniref:Asp23/Gls24 family envelope stress response protein n=1 Tax=Georgenia yuyongxinii TaxID=2589797 RepID=A0A552WN09_9MICO|nr:Asp23/Gls24 family envelope stress response protein [Georgenia yuyongxinii]